jgi:hypothetical protein
MHVEQWRQPTDDNPGSYIAIEGNPFNEACSGHVFPTREKEDKNINFQIETEKVKDVFIYIYLW